MLHNTERRGCVMRRAKPPFVFRKDRKNIYYRVERPLINDKQEYSETTTGTDDLAQATILYYERYDAGTLIPNKTALIWDRLNIGIANAICKSLKDTYENLDANDILEILKRIMGCIDIYGMLMSLSKEHISTLVSNLENDFTVVSPDLNFYFDIINCFLTVCFTIKDIESKKLYAVAKKPIILQETVNKKIWNKPDSDHDFNVFVGKLLVCYYNEFYDSLARYYNKNTNDNLIKFCSLKQAIEDLPIDIKNKLASIEHFNRLLELHLYQHPECLIYLGEKDYSSRSGARKEICDLVTKEYIASCFKALGLTTTEFNLFFNNCNKIRCLAVSTS